MDTQRTRADRSRAELLGLGSPSDRPGFGRAGLAVLARLALALAIFGRMVTPAGATVLEYVGVQRETGGVDGLTGPQSIAFGGSWTSRIYVAANGDSALSRFDTSSTTGLLTYLGIVKDGVGGVDGLANATFVHSPRGNGAFANSGDYVFAAGIGENAVARFRDDGASLTFLGFLQDGVGGVDGLGGARGIATAVEYGSVPFGIFVAGRADHAIAVFRQNADGSVSFLEVERDGVGGVDGLQGVEAVTVGSELVGNLYKPNTVYAAGFLEDAVAVFDYDRTTGLLTFWQVVRDGVDGVDGIARPIALAVSPDQRYVYVAGSGDDSVAWFSRDLPSGGLTYAGKVTDGVGGVDGLDGAYSISLSNDGGLLYAAGLNDGALAVFERDPSTGALTFLEVHKDGVAGVDGLAGVYQVTGADPARRHVYAVGFSDSAVAIFRKRCGDSADDAGEECDDGNNTSGDCCSATCEHEPQCQSILAKSIQIKDPKPGVDPSKRSVGVVAVEKASPDVLLGNPASDGMFVVVWADPGARIGSFYLPPGAAWKILPGGLGFKYSDSKLVNGAVKSLLLRKTPNGTLTFKMTASGKVWPITLLPPNPGEAVRVTLLAAGSLNHGDPIYCLQLGYGAGGSIPSAANNDRIFKITATGTAPAIEVPCSLSFWPE